MLHKKKTYKYYAKKISKLPPNEKEKLLYHILKDDEKLKKDLKLLLISKIIK